jgi:predicted dehydrogenase
LSLQTALQDGDLGQIKIAHLNFDRFRPTPKVRWRESAIEGAGIWFDLGPHLVDQALQLFGRPYAVQSRMVGIREGAVAIDYAHVTLCYETKDVVLRTSPFTADPMLRYQIETDLGTWRKYGLDPQEDYLKQGATFDNEGYIQNLPSEEAIWSTLTEQKTQPLKSGCYMAFYQALANSLLRNNVFPVTIQQALDVAVVIEAAKNSENLQSRYNIVWKDIQSL